MTQHESIDADVDVDKDMAGERMAKDVDESEREGLQAMDADGVDGEEEEEDDEQEGKDEDNSDEYEHPSTQPEDFEGEGKSEGGEKGSSNSNEGSMAVEPAVGINKTNLTYDTKRNQTVVSVDVARVSGSASTRMECDGQPDQTAEEGGTTEWGFEVCRAQVSDVRMLDECFLPNAHRIRSHQIAPDRTRSHHTA